MNYQQLLEQVKDYALNFHKIHNNPNLEYHNLGHTKNVVAAVSKIGNHYQLNDRDYCVVSAAAWFHDLGYMVDLNNHETAGAKLAETFLTDHKVDAKDIKSVVGCINATKMPQSPTNLIEEIICDADLFYLGTEDFAKKDRKLHKEVNTLHNLLLSKQQWHEKSIAFLVNQHYWTDYCKLLLGDGKTRNLKEKEKR